MKTCEWAGASLERRSHPWTDAEGRPDFRYYDLTAQPEHIRTSLEDLRSWQKYPAVEAFYARVEGLKNQLHLDLAAADASFRWGVVGTTVVPVRYLALPETGEQQLGSQL